MNKTINPSCCKHLPDQVVYLKHDGKEIYDECAIKKIKPKWRIDGYNYEYSGHKGIECKICPFCGQKLPDVQLKKKVSKKILKITDGGYYCDTCDERLNCCECYGPEFEWEEVKKEVSALSLYGFLEEPEKDLLVGFEDYPIVEFHHKEGEECIGHPFGLRYAQKSTAAEKMKKGESGWMVYEYMKDFPSRHPFGLRYEVVDVVVIEEQDENGYVSVSIPPLFGDNRPKILCFAHKVYRNKGEAESELFKLNSSNV